jgi:hypothetical protein
LSAWIGVGRRRPRGTFRGDELSGERKERNHRRDDQQSPATEADAVGKVRTGSGNMGKEKIHICLPLNDFMVFPNRGSGRSIVRNRGIRNRISRRSPS